MNMNKFSVINSIVEVASMSELMNKSGGSAGSSLHHQPHRALLTIQLVKKYLLWENLDY